MTSEVARQSRSAWITPRRNWSAAASSVGGFPYSYSVLRVPLSRATVTEEAPPSAQSGQPYRSRRSEGRAAATPASREAPVEVSRPRFWAMT